TYGRLGEDHGQRRTYICSLIRTIHRGAKRRSCPRNFLGLIGSAKFLFVAGFALGRAYLRRYLPRSGDIGKHLLQWYYRLVSRTLNLSQVDGGLFAPLTPSYGIGPHKDWRLWPQPYEKHHNVCAQGYHQR